VGICHLSLAHSNNWGEGWRLMGEKHLSRDIVDWGRLDLKITWRRSGLRSLPAPAANIINIKSLAYIGK
jgi:hypothetical protein